MNPGWWVALGGAAITAVGVLGVQGRLLRAPSSNRVASYSVMLFFGVALTGMGVIAGLEGRAPLLGTVLILPLCVLWVLGLVSVFWRPPRWAVPAWQRLLDNEERSRRKRR